MIRTMLVASIAFCVSLAYTPTFAEACGVKLTVRSPKANKSRRSSNPSKILIVGKRDSDLQKKLRRAGHTVVHASTASKARKAKYGLVIADRSAYKDARDSFSDVQIVARRRSSRSTARRVERALARKSVASKRRRTVVARSNRDRRVVETGGSAGDRRAVTASGRKVAKADTPAPKSRPATPPAGRKTTRVATATKPKTTKRSSAGRKPAPQPAAEKRQKLQAKAKRPAHEVKATRPKPVPNAPEIKWTREFRFGTNKTHLSRASKRKLRRNAKWLQANPDASLTIEGHTDTVGDEAYNMELSERRANAARDFLLGLGVEDSRISVVPRGEEDPAYQPGTSGKNRRVVLIKN